jgi:DNA-binding transcriptional ArsR family regulator
MEPSYAFEPEDAAKLLSLMGHEGRLRVLALIAEKEWDVTSLAKAINLGRPALSQHLKKLRESGIVQTRRDAQFIYYSCRSEAVARILATLRSQVTD